MGSETAPHIVLPQLGIGPSSQSVTAPKANFPAGCYRGPGGAPALGRLRWNRHQLEGNGQDKGLCSALVVGGWRTWVWGRKGGLESEWGRLYHRREMLWDHLGLEGRT